MVKVLLVIIRLGDIPFSSAPLLAFHRTGEMEEQ